MTIEEMARELAHKTEQADQFAKAHSVVAGMLAQSQAAHGATRSEMLRCKYSVLLSVVAQVGLLHLLIEAAPEHNRETWAYFLRVRMGLGE